MERKAVSGILLILLLTSMLAVAFNIQWGQAGGTIYIRADGSVDPPTAPIQRDGDVYTFTGDIYDAIEIERNNIVVDGVWHTLASAISLSNRNNITLKNTSIDGGISLYESSRYICISGNNITGDIQVGDLSTDLSGNNTIEGNILDGMIDLTQSAGNTISGNNITGDIDLVYHSDNNIISGNSIGSGIGLYMSVENNSISGNNIIGGISLYQNCGGNTISANNVTGGIGLVRYSCNNIISGNNVTGTIHVGSLGDGIILQWLSSNNTISGNVITYSARCGIFLEGGDGGPLVDNKILGNKIADSTDVGICLSWSSNNTISGNKIANNSGSGIVLDLCSNSDSIFGNNTIVGNDVRTNDDYGIQLLNSSGNFIYHNSFVDNAEQIYTENSTNVWDDGYPSGGNYWSDYADVDFYSGPNQDLLGMDGIWDHPYVADVDNRDMYPFVKPWSSIPATVDVDPDILSLRSRGNWVTAYIELPEGFQVASIDLTTIVLNGTIRAEPHQSELRDYDNDAIPDLMVKFNRTEAAEFILSKGIMTGNVILTVSGHLIDGTLVVGSDVIKVRMPGDVNVDGKVDIKDITLAVKSFGSYPGHPEWNPVADENEDNKVDAVDLSLIARNFGKTYK